MTNQYFMQTLADAQQQVTQLETTQRLAHYTALSIQIPPQTINGQAWRLMPTKTGNVFYKE